MAINLRQLLLDRAARGIGTGGGLMGTQSNAGLLGNMNPKQNLPLVKVHT